MKAEILPKSLECSSSGPGHSALSICNLPDDEGIKRGAPIVSPVNDQLQDGSRLTFSWPYSHISSSSLTSPVHTNGFSFYIFPGFLAIFILSLNNIASSLLLVLLLGGDWPYQRWSKPSA